MKLNKAILAVFFSCAAMSAAVYAMNKHEMKKMAAIDAVKVFNRFNLKLELENQAKAHLQNMSKSVDSLSNKLQMAKATQNKDEVEKLSYALKYVSEMLEQEYKRTDEEINTLVWKRLNPLIDNYGKERGYHLLIGANGMGNVLYMDNYYDVTEDAITYINNSYENAN